MRAATLFESLTCFCFINPLRPKLRRERTRKVFVLAVCVVVASVCAAFAFERATSSQCTQQNQPHIERTATVNHVIDGDTIALDGGEHVRLVGVDTEEIELNKFAIEKHPELRGMTEEEYEQTSYYQHAITAKSFTDGLCQSGEVGLDVDDLKQKDSHRRTLAVVYAEVDGSWVNINAELLRRGYAEVLYIPPSEFNPYKWI